MDPCQRLCQLIGYRLPVAVKGQQSLVHGGIVPSARRGHGIDIHIRQLEEASQTLPSVSKAAQFTASVLVPE